MRVLIVDDSLVMRRIYMNLIRTEFPEVSFVEVYYGVEAKREVKREEVFDLILVDWNLGDIEGEELLVWFRTEQKMDTPIVVITTDTLKETVIKAIRAGANQYVVKPFQPEAFLDKVRKYLKSPEPETEE